LRARINKTENGFESKNHDGVLSEEQVLQILEAHPENLSPNVVLRPLYQETILPNLCYIGGGAEVSYWLQLKELFASHQLTFPILMLRNSALVMEKNQSDKFYALGFESADIFEQVLSLQKRFIENSSSNITLEDEALQIENLFKSIKEKVGAIDKTLEATVEGESSKNIASIKNLEQKVIRALKRKEETSMSQIEKFKQKYFPSEGLQERNDNFLYFYAKYGTEFLSILKSELDPLENKFIVATIE
jgi:uncharacterized protein YllA (UPF0747 family)